MGIRIETVNLSRPKKSRIIQVNGIVKIDFREMCIMFVRKEKPSEITRIDFDEFDEWESVFIYAEDSEDK